MDSIFVNGKPSKNDITKTEILEIMGNNYEKKKNLEKLNFNTEWRFRFYKFKNKTVVEVSCKNPSEKRKYKTKNKKWIYLSNDDENKIDDIYNDHICDEYYIYCPI